MLTILVCGGFNAGKKTLMRSIVTSIAPYQEFEERDHNISYTTISYQTDSLPVTLLSISHGTLAPEIDIPHFTTTHSQAVIYVIEAIESSHRWFLVPPKSQLWYFELYLQGFRAEHKLWNHIPWMWVVTKSDLGRLNPLENAIQRFDPGGATSVVMGSGKTGENLEPIRQWLANLVRSNV